MAEVRVIGLDIAKSVFQGHGVDAAGATVCGSGLRDRACCRSSRSFLRVWSGSRHAPLRILGLESS